MLFKKCALVSFLIFSSYASVAFSQAAHEGMNMETGKDSASAMMTPFMTETMAGMDAMHKEMMDPAKMNGVPDHDFLVMMIPHHKGAVVMAETLLKHGKEEKVKKLARAIIKDQKKEIAQMEKWIADGVGAKK